jgi:hypothetical protein
MEPPLIVAENLIDLDDTVITGSNVVTTLPVDNLFDYRVGKKSRLSAINSEYWRFQFANPKHLDLFVILSHNFSFSADITITAYSDDFTTSIFTETYKAWPPLFGYGAGGYGVPGYGGSPTKEMLKGRSNIIFNQFDQVIAKSVEVKVLDPNNVDGFLECGRVIVSSGFQLTRYPSYSGTGGKSDDKTKSTINDFGVEQITPLSGKRKKDFNLQSLNAEEARRMEELQMNNGKWRPFLFFQNPEKNENDWFFNYMYCVFDRINSIDPRNSKFFETKLSLKEY